MGYIPILKNHYPDELLYSWICRMANENGLSVKEFANTFLEAGSKYGRVLHYDIRKGYLNFCESMYTKMDGIKLFLDTNTFAFESMFMSEKYQARIVDSAFGKQNKLKMAVRLEISNVNICPLCMEEDIKKYGEPYLHRSHQLSGIETCYKHHCLLHSFVSAEECACDYKKEDYEKIQTMRGIDSNNAYANYAYALFESGVFTNLESIQKIMDDKIEEKGYEEIFRDITNWKYHNLIDYNVEKFLRTKGYRERYLSARKVMPILMFLYPDVQQLISLLKEKSTTPTIQKYKCQNCGKEYVATSYATDTLFGCPRCNEKSSEQELLGKIFEKYGYELKDEYRALNTPVSVLHKKCGQQLLIKPKSFLYENVRCACESRMTFHEVKCQIEESNQYELLEFTSLYDPCKIRSKFCGHIFDVRCQQFLKIPRCRICFPNTITAERMAERIQSWTNGEYEMVGEYVDQNTKIKILHHKCGRIMEYMPKHFNRNAKCPFCNNIYMEQWNKMFQLLCAYKAEYNSMEISIECVYKDQRLGTWCQRQRGAYNAKKISEECLEKLQGIGFSFDPLEDEWNRHFEQYVGYVNKNGKESGDSGNTEIEEERIGKWVQVQREFYRAGKLPQNRLEKLQNVGFSFNPLEEEWDRYFEQYRQCVQEKKELSTFLRQWAGRQRILHKKGKLPHDRYEKLHSIDFLFSPVLDNEWNKQFEQYKKCISEKKTFPTSLKRWVDNQRSLYRKKKLPQDRYEKLQSVDFLFTPLEEEWDKHFVQYQRYIRENGGNANIPLKTVYEGERLGIWVGDQRKMYKKGKLSQKRYQKLLNIGFSVDPLEDEWNRRYEQFKRYIKANDGDTRISGNAIFEGECLGTWVIRQRNLYKKGKLLPERYEKLKQVGVQFK